MEIHTGSMLDEHWIQKRSRGQDPAAEWRVSQDPRAMHQRNTYGRREIYSRALEPLEIASQSVRPSRMEAKTEDDTS